MKKSRGNNRKPVPLTGFEKAIRHWSVANFPVNRRAGIMTYPELG
jgi:hypothetical protein